MSLKRPATDEVTAAKPVKMPLLSDSASEDDEEYDWTNIGPNDLENYVKQMPFPLQGELRVKTPTVQQKLYKNYCVCNKKGKDRDGETFCGTRLTENDQYELFDSFWKSFKEDRLIEFVTFASKKTGRNLIIDAKNEHRLRVNYLSLLLFFTLPECYCALKWLDFLKWFSGKNSQLPSGKKILKPTYLHIPVCLSDEHLLFETGTGDKKLTSRLIKKVNFNMITKFLLSLNQMSDQDMEICGLPVSHHKNKVSDLCQKLEIFKSNSTSPLNERNYVLKMHFVRVKQNSGNFTDELSVISMCEPCKRNQKLCIPLSESKMNPFLL